jgi:asparagine synthase (glutamine-hydrolysing)
MCGIVGTFGPAGYRPEWLARACEALRHRGPDDSGAWCDPVSGIALGHTRLAILDLSEAGRQPMTSACGRYHIVFNGEIYNHLQLRTRLRQGAWRGHSDTETLLACIAEWGLQRTLRLIVGMFAFAVFDAQEQRLALARDRFGEKPLYFGYVSDVFVFASELRAARSAPQFDQTIDRAALALFMRYSYVPGPHSIYSGMHKLRPGCWLELTPQDVARRSLPQPQQYWSAAQVALDCSASQLTLDDTASITELERVLSDAVLGQMLADVPLGAFLSGGIDSSLIVALMQAHSARPVRTFTIGFEEKQFDESVYARRIAAHLGTQHTEVVVSAQDVLDLVPQMPYVYDEPFADSSQLPTSLVARLAHQHVTVALSGDGGDELFGGYPRYYSVPRAWSWLKRAPYSWRRRLARGLRAASPASLERLLAVCGVLIPQRQRAMLSADRIYKSADVLASHDIEELYRRLVSYWWAQSVVLGAPQVLSEHERPWPWAADFRHQAMLLDTLGYLPDDLLVKVDRAAMAVSLETRVPMLDHRVFEFAWRLSARMKVRNGSSKWLLRRLLLRYVPQELTERPKMGFAVPLAAWLRGPLREWGESLLHESALRREGYLDARTVRQRWGEHQSGVRNWHHELWNVLMFQAWLVAAK